MLPLPEEHLIPVGILEDDAERDKAAAAATAQERADARRRSVGVASPGFIRAIHPEHGQPVMFTPGELLPDWAADALNSARGHFDPTAGVFVLDAEQ